MACCLAYSRMFRRFTKRRAAWLAWGCAACSTAAPETDTQSPLVTSPSNSVAAPSPTVPLLPSGTVTASAPGAPETGVVSPPNTPENPVVSPSSVGPGTAPVGPVSSAPPGVAGSDPTPPNAPPPVPEKVNCSPLVAAGYELCDSADDYCGVVFTDGSGCNAVCASAGLRCAAAYENVEERCAADVDRAVIDCDSGHQSDYCRCESDPTASPPVTPTPSSPDVAPATEPSTESTTSPTSSGETPPVSTNPAPQTGPCAVPDYVVSDATPLGWAAQGSGTSGGGAAEPVLVTSLSALQSSVRDDTPRVIYVQGDLAPGDIDVGSNKTIIGCSGSATVRGAVKIGSGSSNIILRNLTVVGYGSGDCALDPSFDASEGCSSGADAIGVNGNAHHVWVDHCSVKDGTDGNLDITNDADFVTVSWTKFSYTPRTDDVGNDSTGAAGHRFSNLVGGTDSEPSGWPNTIPLNVTWHHNWWADNVVERQPRVRFGRNHLFNNYYNSSASNYCVRAGISASILLQGNYFDGVDSPHQFNSESNQETAYIALGEGALANQYDDVSGDQEEHGGGSPFTPPYAFDVEPAANVPSAVRDGAGPH